MDYSQELLSNLTVYSKYARYREDLQRRETWDEIVTRNLDMHKKRYPHLSQEIDKYGKWAKEKKVLGSMRGYQFGGRAIERNNTRLFNCSFLPINNIKAFSEIMFLLLSGSGVGYSVQLHDIENLPEIKKPKGSSKFLIGDSIEGWSDAVRVLIKAYFEGSFLPLFSFDDIRPRGTPLRISGGKAPGSEPLKQCLLNINNILRKLHVGDRIRPIQVHDIICHIADAVLSGGIRRSAMIALFSVDDEEMANCKTGDWWKENPQRARANNSAVFLRYRLTRKDFEKHLKTIKESKSGDPGFILSNDRAWGLNPCGEASLRPYQFCNLVEIDGSNIGGEEDFQERIEAAAFFSTLQAGYTDFHYLREAWRKATEKDALLGVGITGLASNKISPSMLIKGALTILSKNKIFAQLIDINPTARATLIKPSGTSSLVLGTSSGIHAWHSDFYLRRMKFNPQEGIFQYLNNVLPGEFIEDSLSSSGDKIIALPIKAPEGAIVREKEKAIELLERVVNYHKYWVLSGHVSGNNTHAISATINVKEGEWKELGEMMWEQRDHYNNLSIFPEEGSTHPQLPFEGIGEGEYVRKIKMLGNISLDFTQVREYSDETELRDNLACAGGVCEI